MDCLTKGGCPLAWPFSEYEFRWYPKKMAFTTDTWREHLVVVPLLLIALAFLAWHAANLPGIRL
jgi:hypothetical protein